MPALRSTQLSRIAAAVRTARRAGLLSGESRSHAPEPERTIPVTWPSDIPSLDGYRFGDESFNHDTARRPGTTRHREAALLERLTDTPISEWSEEDVRGVIRSTPDQNRAATGQETWHARVRAYGRAASDG